MDQRPLGATGIFVSRQCLGTMMLGSFGNPDHGECVSIIRAALDAGITFLNTADGYSGGEAEEIIGEALTDGRRDGVVLSVKFGRRSETDPNTGGGSRRSVVRSIDGSLRRLRTDWIDVYELGVPDPWTDLDETLGVLTELATAGKIRAFGTSKMPASRLVEARWLAERRGHGVFRTEEPPYSMLTRAIEYDLLPTCQRLGVGVLAYSPLGRGWLSGRYRTGAPAAAPGSSRRASERRMDAAEPRNAPKLEAVHALGRLADEAGLTLVQLATAFATVHPAVTSTIIGPRTLDQLQGSLAADGVMLGADLLDRIDAIVPPGTTVDPADNMWAVGTDALTPSRLRASV